MKKNVKKMVIYLIYQEYNRVMPPKKKVALSPHKLPTWFMTPDLSNCLKSKCKKEQGQLKNNKYVIEKKKVSLII